jgi:hypothetical protein
MSRPAVILAAFLLLDGITPLAWAGAALILGAAAALGLLWKEPGTPADDIEALIEATRELPPRWTAGDWAELEKVSKP